VLVGLPIGLLFLLSGLVVNTIQVISLSRLTLIRYLFLSGRLEVMRLPGKRFDLFKNTDSYGRRLGFILHVISEAVYSKMRRLQENLRVDLIAFCVVKHFPISPG
jgi:hypothetical protein